MQGLIPGVCKEAKQLESGAGQFPLCLSPAGKKTTQDLAALLTGKAPQLRALAMKHGAVLLRGFEVNTAQDFATVVKTLDCEDYPYVGGAAPRTELVPNLVFTSNESPPEEPIPFHHELAQSPVPPSYILFMCEIEAKQGGATPIIHSVEVANFCKKKYPEFADKLRKLGVRYIRSMPFETDTNSALGRSWKETYLVKTKEEAEAAMKKHGTSYEWLPDGSCKTITAVLPAMRIDPRSGQEVFFNSVVAAYLGWYDARNNGKDAIMFGDGSKLDTDAIEGIAAFMKERRVVFQWKKGDVLVIDNSLVMHSRDTFVPPRRVLASVRGKPIEPRSKL